MMMMKAGENGIIRSGVNEAAHDGPSVVRESCVIAVARVVLEMMRIC